MLFDKLIAYHPELLEKSERTRLIQYIRRRADWPSTNEYSCYSDLLNRLLSKEDLLTIDPICSEKPTLSPRIHRTQVAIVGAGPAGLMLGALLWRSGIDSVILEHRSRSEVESVIRAGVLEQSTIDLLDEIGASERLFRQGIVQYHVNFQFDGDRVSVPVFDMTEGKTLIVYGQQYVLQDLIRTRIDSGQRIYFDVANVTIERHDVTGKQEENHLIQMRTGQTS